MSYSEMDYGDRLRSIRNRRGYTTTQVSEAIHISQSYLSAFENKRRTPDLDILERILGFYGVSFEEFFMDAGFPEDIQNIIDGAKSLTVEQRRALDIFLKSLSARQEQIKWSSKTNIPRIQEVANHLEEEYGIYDEELAQHLIGKIKLAQNEFDTRKNGKKD